jgi:hypothetical protein
MPPNKRQQQHNAAAPPRTEKKELKKEHQFDNPALFPTLASTLKTIKIKDHSISFSSAAAKKSADKEEVKKPEVAPGWVHIRKHKGIIQYKYGAPVPFKDYTEQEDIFVCNALFKYRLAREQYARDMDVARLGDLSEYYDEPTLAEIQE